MSTNLDRLLTPEEAKAYLEARKAEQGGFDRDEIHDAASMPRIGRRASLERGDFPARLLICDPPVTPAAVHLAGHAF